MRRLWMVLAIAGFVVAGAYSSRSAPVSASGRSRAAVAGRAAARAHAGTPSQRIPVRCAHRNKASGAVKLGEPDIGAIIPGNSQVWSGMFDDLFRTDSHARLFPMMATAVPTLKNGGIKDGGRTVIIHLKHGLRWSNNTEITSADIGFGWRVLMDPKTGPVCAGTCDVIRRIDTPDRYTAVLRLKTISASLLTSSLGGGPGGVPFLWPTTWPHAWSDDPHAAAVKLFASSWNEYGLNYPTNGPYYAVRKVGPRSILLRPMPYYDDMTCGASVANVIDVSYTSGAAMLAAAVNQKADVARGFDYEFLPDLQGHSGTFAFHADPSFDLERLEFNVAPTYQDLPNPVADTKVRLALALAIDKIKVIGQALATTNTTAAKRIEAWSFAVNTPSVVQPFADRTLVGQWDPIAKKLVTDTGHGQALADARRLLAGTPWKRGFTLDFYSNASGSISRIRRREAREVIADWAKIGVTLNVHFIDGFPPSSPNLFGSWADGGILEHGAFQVTLVRTTGEPVDLDAWKYNLQSKYIVREHPKNDVGQNYSGIHDAAIDRGFDRAGSTVNLQVRSADYAAIQREVNRRAYWIPLHFPPQLWTSDRRVRNVTLSPGVWGNVCWDMYAWRVKGH
jgi:ABC-type transport system substrate-binding protein